jgi:hypothetical protein
MKKLKIKTPKPTPIIIIALSVAVVAGYLGYSNSLEAKRTAALEKSKDEVEVKTDFSFKTVKSGAGNFIEIYKKGELVNTVLVKDGTVVERSFKVSPDNKYVAFEKLHPGKACVLWEEPQVINLSSGTIETLSPASANPGKRVTVDGLVWDGGNKVVAKLHYGLEGTTECGQNVTVATTYKIK